MVEAGGGRIKGERGGWRGEGEGGGRRGEDITKNKQV